MSLASAPRRLPRTARTTSSAPTDLQPPSRVTGASALVVDDDPASAKLLAVLLRGEGFHVRVAGSAEEALDQLRTFQPHAVVLDLVLPLMSGLLLAQRLKADPATRDIVLIAVTSLSGSEGEAVALQAGCAAYLRKPIDALSFADDVLALLGAAR
jgi:CheY-like chemotaxis protein